MLGLLPLCYQSLCRVDHIHSPAENGWKEYQREYGYRQTGYGPQGSHDPPDSQQPKTSIFGGLKDTAGDSQTSPLFLFLLCQTRMPLLMPYTMHTKTSADPVLNTEHVQYHLLSFGRIGQFMPQHTHQSLTWQCPQLCAVFAVCKLS